MKLLGNPVHPKGLAIAALLLAGCDSVLPQGCASTPRAGFERMAMSRHRYCVENNPCQFVSECHRESEAFCVDAGYAKACGDGDIEGSCGVGVK